MKFKRNRRHPKWSNNKTCRVCRYATQRARNSRTPNSSCNRTRFALLRGKTIGQPVGCSTPGLTGPAFQLHYRREAGGKAGTTIERKGDRKERWIEKCRERETSKGGEMAEEESWLLFHAMCFKRGHRVPTSTVNGKLNPIRLFCLCSMLHTHS